MPPSIPIRGFYPCESIAQDLRSLNDPTHGGSSDNEFDANRVRYENSQEQHERLQTRIQEQELTHNIEGVLDSILDIVEEASGHHNGLHREYTDRSDISQ